MLEKLKLAFSRKEEESADLAELLMAQRELEGEAEAAHIRLERVRMEVNGELLAAIAAGDEKRRTAARKKLDAAQADVAEIDHALAGLASRVEAARAAEAEQAAVTAKAERARLAAEREQAAVDMQRNLEGLADAFRRFDALGRKVEGISTRREIERLGLGDFDLIAAIGAQLACRTAGRLGDMNTLRGFTVGEFQARGLLADLPDLAHRQHARLGLIAPEIKEAA